MKLKYKNMNIIGSDETGVGDYLTPLVASAVFVPYQNVEKLERLGVIDSKKMTDKNIRNLAKKIKPLVVHSTKQLSQKGYNKLNKSFNANELKMFLHISAINKIEESAKDVSLIIIDQFSNESSIKKYYDRLLKSSFDFVAFKTKYKLVTKGESEHVAVAAASILAREKLLSLMDIQNKKWNVRFPLGTNKIVESFILDFVRKNGKETLNEVAKIKFKTTKKLFG